jgi:hypothetical protein
VAEEKAGETRNVTPIVSITGKETSGVWGLLTAGIKLCVSALDITNFMD